MANTPKLQVPKRWQRSRRHGMKQPTSCRYVGRPTMYANKNHMVAGEERTFGEHKRVTKEYELDMKIILSLCPEYFDDLLHYEWISCFCPLDMPCHCDPIIEHLSRRIKELEGEKS